MNNVYDANPVVERRVHVLPKGIYPVGDRLDKAFAGADALLEHVTSSGMKKRLLIGKVSIESSNAKSCAFCHCVARWLPANLQDQLDHRLDEHLSVLLCISAHRYLPLVYSILTIYQAEDIPPFKPVRVVAA